MKTQVIMKRELFGKEISQQSKTEFFSATDLVRAGNAWRNANGLSAFSQDMWLQRKSTKEFIVELEKEFGTVKVSGRGRGKHTWLHPLLFIDLALALNPKLKVEVYKWLYDQLLRFRNNSGDSFKKMAGSLYAHANQKSKFDVSMKKVSLMIQDACGVKNWQTASEDQLALRDRIHNNIALLADVLSDNNSSIRIGIAKALKE